MRKGEISTLDLLELKRNHLQLETAYGALQLEKLELELSYEQLLGFPIKRANEQQLHIPAYTQIEKGSN